MMVTEIRRDVTMPDGRVLTVVAYTGKACYGAYLLGSSGQRLPCALIHEPVGLGDALDIAVAFVKRVNAKCVLA